MTYPDGENEGMIPPSSGYPEAGPPSGAAVAGDRVTTDFDRVQRRNLRNVAIVVSVLLAVVVIGGFTYRAPYVALIPGSAKDTEPLVEVEGLESYPSDGELLFTTVRLRSRPNLWEYLWLVADDDSEVVPEEFIYGDRSVEENREVNLQAMTDSKTTAVAVALEQLGYDAIVESGVFVADTIDGTAAASSLERGDVILAVDGVETMTDLQLVDVLKTYAVGDEIVLRVERFGTNESEDVRLVLGPRDDDPNAAFLGVAPQTRITAAEDLPFNVAIDSGSVGGPSAGLAFTLAVLDMLTPGELTGGSAVAITGTIGPDGRVGSVGGVEQKAAAVREMGVKTFIVPRALGEATLDAVRARAGDEVEIIPVETLDEALVALENLGGDTGAIEEFAAGNL